MGPLATLLIEHLTVQTNGSSTAAQLDGPPIDGVVVVPPAAQLDGAAHLIGDDNNDIVGR